MKIKMLPILAGFCLLGLVSGPVFADAQSTDPSEQQLIKTLTDRTELLENQVSQLQTEIKTIKSKPAKKTQPTKKIIYVKKPVSSQAPVVVPGTIGTPAATPTPVAVSEATGAPPITPATAGLTPPPGFISPYHPGKSFSAPVYLIADKPLYIGGTPVVSSPYLGIDSQFNASDLITQLSYVNEDLDLLQERMTLEDNYEKNGLPVPTHPFVELSGQIQATVFGLRPFQDEHVSDIDVTDGELDTLVGFNSWVTGLMAFLYDNSPPNLGPRVNNSRVFMDRGFLTIGNLTELPIYGTLGQIYVPFGVYNTNMIDNPFTLDLARTKARSVVLGFDKTWCAHELNVSLFTFRGDTVTDPDTRTINNWGANAIYKYTQEAWNAAIGASYINNIADSLGMQLSNAGASGFALSDFAEGFNGFGGTLPAVGAEVLEHRVPAVDVNGMLGVGNFTLIAEGVKTTRAFSPADLTFNDDGARPGALNAELAYKIPWFIKPAVFAVGYEQTQDALALLLPRKRYLATLNFSLWRDTVESLEVRHDINYDEDDTATGQGVIVAANGLGRISNAIIAQVTAYF